MPKRTIRPIRIDGNLAYIPLTKGYEAIVDAGASHLVSGYNWQALEKENTIYAMRTGPRPTRATIYMHRSVLDVPTGMNVDHIDGNGLNNTLSNLRAADDNENARNQRLRKDSKSGLKGVSWRKNEGVWMASIRVNGVKVWLGRHKTKEAAYMAYCEASAELHGEFGSVS